MRQRTRVGGVVGNTRLVGALKMTTPMVSAIDDHVEDYFLNEDIHEEEMMPEKESSADPGYRASTHHDVCRLICEALEEHK